MITFLKGKIYSKSNNSIVMDVNGIGYLLYVPSVDKFIISDNQKIIFTYLYVREDRIVLYGFVSEIERDFFKVLIDTPGIGPKVALNILADMLPARFQAAVIKEDLNIISSISGIGKKMAQKIVLELKEKLKLFNFDDNSLIEDSEKGDFVDDAIEALKALGYHEKEAKKRIANALERMNEEETPNIEALIKNALNKTKNI